MRVKTQITKGSGVGFYLNYCVALLRHANPFMQHGYPILTSSRPDPQRSPARLPLPPAWLDVRCHERNNPGGFNASCTAGLVAMTAKHVNAITRSRQIPRPVHARRYTSRAHPWQPLGWSLVGLTTPYPTRMWHTRMVTLLFINFEKVWKLLYQSVHHGKDDNGWFQPNEQRSWNHCYWFWWC